MRASLCASLFPLASMIEIEHRCSPVTIGNSRALPIIARTCGRGEQPNDYVDFEVRDENIKSPQARPRHAENSNDRSMAYAKRLALDLEMMAGSGPAFPELTVALFLDFGRCREGGAPAARADPVGEARISTAA